MRRRARTTCGYCYKQSRISDMWADFGNRRRPHHEVAGTTQPAFDINMGDFLFPLRYDLIKRAEFYEFYVKNRELWRTDRNEFLRQARSTIAYLHPLLMNPWMRRHFNLPERSLKQIKAYADKALEANCEKSIDIWESIEKSGFDPQVSMIYLKEARDPLPTVTGREPPPDTWYFSDGQHRLTALIAMGHTVLKQGWWGVKIIVSAFRPLEATHMYIEEGLMTEEDYVDFARWRFQIPPEIVSAAELAEYAESTDDVPVWVADWTRAHWGLK